MPETCERILLNSFFDSVGDLFLKEAPTKKKKNHFTSKQNKKMGFSNRMRNELLQQKQKKQNFNFASFNFFETETYFFSSKDSLKEVRHGWRNCYMSCVRVCASVWAWGVCVLDHVCERKRERERPIVSRRSITSSWSWCRFISVFVPLRNTENKTKLARFASKYEQSSQLKNDLCNSQLDRALLSPPSRLCCSLGSPCHGQPLHTRGHPHNSVHLLRTDTHMLWSPLEAQVWVTYSGTSLSAHMHSSKDFFWSPNTEKTSKTKLRLGNLRVRLLYDFQLLFFCYHFESNRQVVYSHDSNACNM